MSLKLDYFDCISPLPLPIVNVGLIKSIKLIDIAEISYLTYAQYVAHLRMTPEDYFETYFKDQEIDIDTVFNMMKFDIILTDDMVRQIITMAFNFFFVEDFRFYPEYEAFVATGTDEEGNLTAKGNINRENYADIIDIILQRIHITPDANEVDDVKKIKNKRGKKIYEKLMKGRKNFKKAKANSSNMTLANIIAAVATRSDNLNWISIWDISVFQLFDAFERLQINDSYSIASAQVAAWGDKEKQFKLGRWADNIYDKKEGAN